MTRRIHLFVLVALMAAFPLGWADGDKEEGDKDSTITIDGKAYDPEKEAAPKLAAGDNVTVATNKGEKEPEKGPHGTPLKEKEEVPCDLSIKVSSSIERVHGTAADSYAGNLVLTGTSSCPPIKIEVDWVFFWFDKNGKPTNARVALFGAPIVATDNLGSGFTTTVAVNASNQFNTRDLKEALTLIDPAPNPPVYLAVRVIATDACGCKIETWYIIDVVQS